MGKRHYETGSFNPETLTYYQEKVLQILQEHSEKEGVEVYDYHLQNENPSELQLIVIWTDYTTKFSSLSLSIQAVSKESLTFNYIHLNHSLTTEYFKNQYAPFQLMVNKILQDKKQL